MPGFTFKPFIVLLHLLDCLEAASQSNRDLCMPILTSSEWESKHHDCASVCMYEWPFHVAVAPKPHQNPEYFVLPGWSEMKQPCEALTVQPRARMAVSSDAENPQGATQQGARFRVHAMHNVISNW